MCLAGLLLSGAALAQPATPATPALADAPGANATEAPAGLKNILPQGKLWGEARLKVWGFEVYDVRLWAPASFVPNRHTSSALALELIYLRSFQAADIAERSLKEMRRSQSISEAQAMQWTADMLRVIPNVRKSDRIVGVHRPGLGAAFWFNGQPTGEIRDTEFARLFFGIWLSPNTSEPRMREALLTGASE